MIRKKYISFFLIAFLLVVFPVSKGYADEKKDSKAESEKENPAEIIKREDTPTNENVPDPPKDEKLIGDEDEIQEIEIETPASVTGEKMEGNGTVVDFSTNGSRAFYTIVDNDNNTFYLIIDMDKADNNVYFLSDINKEELSGSAGNVKHEPEPKKEETMPAAETDVKDTGKEESSNTGFLITVVVIGLAGALGYHFLIKNRRPKDQVAAETAATSEEDEDEDRMDQSYNDPDVQRSVNPEEEQTGEKDSDKK